MVSLAKVVNLRTGMASVVVGVAGVAAVQSFSHIYWLARTHGQEQLDSVLMPLGVDGLIVAMTLVLLEQVRQGKRAPRLAYAMLWLGILATVGANILFGIRYGIVGSIVSAWPAVAFLGAVHVMTEVAGTWQSGPATVPVWSSEQAAEGADPPLDPIEAARQAYLASVEAESPLSERRLARQFGISRPKAKQIRQSLTLEGATA